jgi:hypothetical protein
MGYLHKGVCYPTEELARADLCSNAFEQLLVGSDVHVQACTSFDFSEPVYDVTTTVNGVVTNLYTLAYPPFPDCDHTYTTGLIGAWLGAAMLIAATLWGLRKLIDLFSGRLDE